MVRGLRAGRHGRNERVFSALSRQGGRHWWFTVTVRWACVLAAGQPEGYG
jgi:hypothetical protein